MFLGSWLTRKAQTVTQRPRQATAENNRIEQQKRTTEENNRREQQKRTTAEIIRTLKFSKRIRAHNAEITGTAWVFGCWWRVKDNDADLTPQQGHPRLNSKPVKVTHEMKKLSEGIESVVETMIESNPEKYVPATEIEMISWNWSIWPGNALEAPQMKMRIMAAAIFNYRDP